MELLGVLPAAHVAATGYDVTPVVGWWHEQHPLEIVDTVEVAAIHKIQVGDLIDPANRLTWRLPMGHRGPGFTIGELFIWGFTAALLDGLIELAGWQRRPGMNAAPNWCRSASGTALSAPVPECNAT